jgi:hypothetical protein
MTHFKRQTFWTIGLSFFIIIGVGHGIICLGLLAIVGLFYGFNINTEDFSLSLLASYDKSLMAAALFALAGHILLILSLVTKISKTYFWTKITGLLLLWVSFYYLTHNLQVDTAAQMSFVTGLPFLIVSIVLAYNITRQKTQSAYD